MSLTELVCTKCILRGHTTKAHFNPVKKITANHLEPADETCMFTCGPGYSVAATSFLDGAVNIGQVKIILYIQGHLSLLELHFHKFFTSIILLYYTMISVLSGCFMQHFRLAEII